MRYRLIFVVLFVGLVAFPAQAAEKKTNTTIETYKLLDLFGEVFRRARSNYVKKVDDRELIEAALDGMLTSLDPHSSYMNQRNFKETQIQNKGEFGGLGIEVAAEGRLIKIISPIDDTPAFRAGLQSGDFIIELDGKPVIGLTLSQVVDKMRGKVGTNIKLKIRRKGHNPFEVTITRAIIKIRSVKSRLEDNIGYVRITSFSKNTENLLKKEVKNLKEKADGKLMGIILDLRNNPGGLFNQAVAVADAFLDKGEIVSTRSERYPDKGQRVNARTGDITAGLPIVVLINGGSASSSEIVAGALQDHGRAILLGTRSFGKGSVQTIVPLGGGHGAMRLTTARYFTPSGRSIQAKGIEPDIEVHQARIEEIGGEQRYWREADLRGALKNNGENSVPVETNKIEEKKKMSSGTKGVQQDYQLLRAVDLLRGMVLLTRKAKN